MFTGKEVTPLFGYRLGLKPKDEKEYAKLLALDKILLPVVIPTLPPAYSQFNVSGSPMPQMWGNDQHGDCVEVDLANHQQHYELIACGQVIPITTANVLKFYHNISGPGDNGTDFITAMQYWQSKGLVVGQNALCKKSNTTTYTIDGFTSVNWLDINQVKAAIYLLGGLDVGVNLPQSAEQQYADNQPWTIVPNSPIIGGHGLYFGAYDDAAQMLTCCTWGKKQLVSYDWFKQYPNQAFASVDNKNEKTSTMNIPLLNEYLQSLSTV